jgi:hypothetical protein
VGYTFLRHCTDGSDERLPEHLAAIDPLPPGTGPATTEQVLFQALEIQYGNEIIDGIGIRRFLSGHGDGILGGW